jgi:hypothetical protein
MGVLKIKTFFQLGNNPVTPEMRGSVPVIGVVKGQLRILHELFPLNDSGLICPKLPKPCDLDIRLLLKFWRKLTDSF